MTQQQSGLRAYWLACLFAAADVVLLGLVYERLPVSMPLLWSGDGEVIASMAKPMGAWVLPLIHLFLLAFLISAPSMDPGSLRSADARRFYPRAVAFISGFLLFVAVLVFARALGASLSVPHGLFGGLGVLLILIGNYLGKVPRNYMVGIRTPWTLSSDIVWERTHRFAAPLFVASGIVLAVFCIAQRAALDQRIALAFVAVTLCLPFFHSFIVWKRIENKN